MVADAEVVRDREARIRRYAADLREMGTMAEAAFLEHRERQYAVLHALQLAIEASVGGAEEPAIVDPAFGTASGDEGLVTGDARRR